MPKSYEKAFILFKAAAQQNNIQAQDNLAHLYQQGLGVAQNNILAYAWYNQMLTHEVNSTADSKLINDAKTKLYQLERVLGEKKIAQAQALTLEALIKINPISQPLAI